MAVNYQVKINKILMALKIKGRIILMSTEQFYSKKFEKVCTKFCITEQTPEKQEIKIKLKSLKKDKEKNKEQIALLENELQEKFINTKLEFFNKIDVLLFLVDLHKEVGVKNG